MEQLQTQHAPALDNDHGYYSVVSLTNPKEVLEEFFSDPMNVEKVLTGIPSPISNFLDLELESADADRVVYRNKNAHAPGQLIFLLQENQFHPGSLITVEAKLGNIRFRDEGPSTLMNLFLRRMKQLIETGEIATTKGQPSGREEIKH